MWKLTELYLATILNSKDKWLAGDENETVIIC